MIATLRVGVLIESSDCLGFKKSIIIDLKNDFNDICLFL